MESNNLDKEKEEMIRLLTNIKTKEIEMKDLIRNTDYINWLINFTNKQPNFSNATWLYNKGTISDEDLKKIDKLELFYEGIEWYTKKNYLYPVVVGNMTFYYIKYHDLGFKIGILEGQGTECFCSRIEIDKKLNFIDFNDVLTNKKQSNVSKISKELEKIINRIEKAYQSGVPIEAIKNVVETVFDETYEKQEIKMKSL